MVAQEQLVQEATQDVGVGAQMEATSHYLPTVERTGCAILTTALGYQQMRAKSQQTSLMGGLCINRRWNDKKPGLDSDCVDIKWINTIGQKVYHMHPLSHGFTMPLSLDKLTC